MRGFPVAFSLGAGWPQGPCHGRLRALSCPGSPRPDVPRAVTGAAAVWLAARNALGSNRDTIEIVHLLGGNDDQIARIFQRSILVDALGGGALGLAIGTAAVWVMGAQFAALDSGLVTGGGLETSDWLVLALVPVGAVVLAVYTARFTVLASLRKML